VEGGVSFPLGGPAFLKLMFGVSYMYLKFEARDGYYQYGPNNHDPSMSNPYVPWNPGWPNVHLNGLGIDYTQHWLILCSGMEAGLLFDYFSISTAISASPLVWCYAFDNHYKRDPPFLTKETLKGGLYFEPRLNVGFAVTEHLNLGLTVAYRNIKQTRGNTEIDEYYPAGTQTSSYNDIAGAGFNALLGYIHFSCTF
jgi:outer membrane protease